MSASIFFCWIRREQVSNLAARSDLDFQHHLLFFVWRKRLETKKWFAD
jgi:hypothetical protein